MSARRKTVESYLSRNVLTAPIIDRLKAEAKAKRPRCHDWYSKHFKREGLRWNPTPYSVCHACGKTFLDSQTAEHVKTHLDAWMKDTSFQTVTCSCSLDHGDGDAENQMCL